MSIGGTKWNACEAEQVDDHTIIFQTAWSAPHPVIEKLAKKFPTVEIVHEWADEDIGQNCGIFDYIDGERIGEVYADGLDEPIKFACMLWDYDYDDYMNDMKEEKE